MDHAATLILLFLFAGLFIALIKGGWTGPGGATSWFKAKFLGQVT
jgi:hypothetical protein